MKQQKRTLFSVCIALFLLLSIVGVHQTYRLFFCNLHSKNGQVNFIHVYPTTSIEQLVQLIERENKFESKWSFYWHARLMKFSHAKAGYYQLNPTESNIALIRRLRNGEQTPIKLTFNNIRTKEQLASNLSKQLMIDSTSIVNLLNDSEYLKQFGLTPQTAICMFIPDTYEVYWNISASRLCERMFREWQLFWNEERTRKAQIINLSSTEVSTLASIIEEETNKNYEKPIVAGLYLNRLQLNMLLQACPTVKFAWQDFSLQRVLNKHLQIDSPYNTYKYAGLPPGPIRIPTAATIDAVLNYTHHNYLYMCAKETLNGEHNFATTLAEHNKNAARYHDGLNKRKIY